MQWMVAVVVGVKRDSSIVELCWIVLHPPSHQMGTPVNLKIGRWWSMRYQLPQPLKFGYCTRAGAYRVGRTRRPHNLLSYAADQQKQKASNVLLLTPTDIVGVMPRLHQRNKLRATSCAGINAALGTVALRHCCKTLHVSINSDTCWQLTTWRFNSGTAISFIFIYAVSSAPIVCATASMARPTHSHSLTVSQPIKSLPAALFIVGWK